MGFTPIQGGFVLPAITNAANADITAATRLAAWGDSLTQGAGSTGQGDYPDQFAILTGLSVYNGGIGGNTSTQIAARMLADTAKYVWPTIIWAGRNNFSGPSTVEADIASMVAALGHQNYLVLSILNGNSASEYSGGPDYATITGINAYLSSIYGVRYLDVRSYLVSLYNPSIPQDVIDHGHDIPPSSIRSDTIHLNNAGYAAVASYIFQQKLSILTPTPNTKVLVANNLPFVFGTPPTIGQAVPPNIYAANLSATGTVTLSSNLSVAVNTTLGTDHTDSTIINGFTRTQYDATHYIDIIPQSNSDALITTAGNTGSLYFGTYSGTGAMTIGNDGHFGANSATQCQVSGSGGLSVSGPTTLSTLSVTGNTSTQAKLVVGSTNVGAGQLQVASTDSGTTMAASAWSSGWTVFGPNAPATGGALGIGYSTTSDEAQISAVSPNVAWKPLRVSANNYAFETSGNSANGVQIDSNGILIALNGVRVSSPTGPRWTSGSGSPNGVVTGSPGDLYSNTAGGAGTTLYVKESGSNTNTGWVGK